MKNLVTIWPASRRRAAGHRRPRNRPCARRATFSLWLLTCAFGSWASGQSYSINWYKVAGGGGSSTGGVYSVSGTIGQPDAGGPMTGGTFSLTGGFWALYAVQTPGAPLLRIFLTTTNTAVIAWPAPSTGWNLEVNSNLSNTNWSPAGGTMILVGPENQVIISPPTGSRFYRLSNP